MQLPLRARILLFVTAINTLVFGVGLGFLLHAARTERERTAVETCDALSFTLQQSIAPRGEIRVAALLRWPSWHYFEDAIFVRSGFVAGPRGAPQPVGAWLNPFGRASRDPLLDEHAVIRDIATAIEREERIESHGGLAIPVFDSEGEVWGGCWLLPDTHVDTAGISRRLALWFLLSTAVLTLGTFLALRRFVLDLAATGELAAGIAHEVNNPLGGLLNAVEALEKKELGPEKRAQYLGLLKHGLERIQRTVGQLLRFTPRGRETVPMSLVEPVVDAVGLVAWRARKQGVVIAFAGEDVADPRSAAALTRARALPAIEGDPSELAQAVLNLLVNALDALEDARQGAGGRVDLSIAQRGDELVLVVQDDGPGVPPELLPRVADLFFTTKEVGKGTGLGLSIVHNAVMAHGGRVLLSNTPGAGLRVELVFPLRRADRAGGRA
ncbi:MAG: HAMP domain-containing histidine kinase [Planctomycetes bacterium]|nr:HAMP domain-containing histidine kinase [Planctomycetota bacterium]